MARMVKVSKEKAKKERAREAGDKKVADMRKLREENQKRAESIKDRRDKQLKIIRDEKRRETMKNPMRDAGPKRDPEISKEADLLIQRVPFQRMVREIVQK